MAKSNEVSPAVLYTCFTCGHPLQTVNVMDALRQLRTIRRVSFGFSNGMVIHGNMGKMRCESSGSIHSAVRVEIKASGQAHRQ